MTPMTDEEAKVDESWRKVAEGAREAIRHLGYPVVMKRCMPGENERESCDGTVAQHALSYFAVISAIADHQLMHLQGPGFQESFNGIYAEVVSEIGCRH